nr:hypothetical protein [Tanacetum cinerariifolium]
MKDPNKGLVAEIFDWDEEEVSDDKEVTQVNVLMALADDELTVKKNHARNELITEPPSKPNINENLFIPASMGYYHKIVPKFKDWVERQNLDNKLPNFNTGRILVPKSQVVNKSLKPTKGLSDPESSKDSKVESITPFISLEKSSRRFTKLKRNAIDLLTHPSKERHGLGIMKHTNPKTQDSSNRSVSGTVTVSETEPITPSVPTEVKNTDQESKINE